MCDTAHMQRYRQHKIVSIVEAAYVILVILLQLVVLGIISAGTETVDNNHTISYGTADTNNSDYSSPYEVSRLLK